MRNTGIAKFFIACAIVFCIGLISLVLGAAFGGIEGFQEVAEKREWIQGDPGEEVREYVKVGDFDKVEIEGCADVNFMTKEWCSDEADEDGSEAAYRPGEVLVIRGSKVDAPEIKVEKGVLHIKSAETEFEGINLNFSSVARTPGVFVYCTGEQLRSIRTDITSGNLSLMGISFDKASIGSVSGDIYMKKVKGKNLNVNVLSGDVVISGKVSNRTSITTESGDVKLNGKFLGKTTADLTSGDLSYDTTLSKDDFTMDMTALSGDVMVSVGGERTTYEDNNNVKIGKGPNTFTVSSSSGDIDISFAGDLPEIES